MLISKNHTEDIRNGGVGIEDEIRPLFLEKILDVLRLKEVLTFGIGCDIIYLSRDRAGRR